MTGFPANTVNVAGSHYPHLGGDGRSRLRLVSADMDSWGAVLDAFAGEQRAGNLSEKTIRNRRECLELLARHAGRGPRAITRDDLVAHLGRMHPRTGLPIAAGTKQSERSYLQTFFKWAKRQGFRKDNPAKTLPKVKIPRRKPRPLYVHQIDAMLDSGAYTRTRDIITIAALTGLRIGEIVKIRGEDVDLQARTLYTLRKGGLEHTVVLHEVLLEIAKRYPRKGWWFPSPYKNRMFPNGGGHILMKSASDRVAHAIREAGVTDRRLTGHSLRHYYATTLLRQGVHVRVVQEMLGHASLATTQLYAEVTDDEMHQAIDVMPPIAIRERSGRRERMAA